MKIGKGNAKKSRVRFARIEKKAMKMTNAEYHADKSLSKSAIDLILECPALYKVWADGVEDREETDATKFGSMAHTVCLEPESFGDEYAVTDLNLSTKDGRAWKSELPQGVKIVKEGEYEKAYSMAEAARNHPQGKHLFKNFIPEKPIFWEYKGIKCKAKPDGISSLGATCFCMDYKATESSSPEAIARNIEKYHYYRQAAWYLLGLEKIGQKCEAFIFVFVEKKYPHIVTVCQLDDDYLEIGRRECDHAVDILLECQATGKYPCYAPTSSVLTISPPKWRKGMKNEPRLS